MDDRSRWRVEGPHGVLEVCVLPASAAILEDRARDASPLRDEGERPSPLARLRLRAMAGDVIGHDPEDLTVATSIVSWADRQGRLRWVRGREVSRGGGGGGASTDAQETAHDPAPVETKTWIAVQLEWDTDPPRPAAGVRYRITLTDGTVREGRLDAAGLARFDGLDPGICTVVFPDLDGESTSLVVPGSSGRSSVTGAGEPAAPLPPPPVCRAVKIKMLEPRGRTSYRKIGPDRVLQVVPAATHKIGGGFGFTFTTANGGAMPALDELREAKAAWKAYKANKAAPKTADSGKKPVEITARLLAATLGGGVSRLYARVHTTPACTDHHALLLKGPGVDAVVQPRERFELAFQGTDLGARSVPTVYELSAEGCEGQPASLRIEAFPPTVRVFSASLEATLKHEVVDRICAWISRLTRNILKVEGELAGFAQLEILEGWREEDRDWNAYWTQQVSVRVGGAWRMEGRGSFAPWQRALPEAVQKYAPDFGLIATSEMSLSAAYSHERREEPGAYRTTPGNTPKRTVHSVPVELKSSISFGGFVRVGSEKFLGAMLTATVDTELGGQIAVEWDAPKFKLDGRADLSEGRFVLKVVGAALFWSGATSWEFPLWSKETLMSDEPWFVTEGQPT
jgi:hypothetical protein